MLKVGALLRFLSELNPQNTPARLALYNWLKGFSTAEEALSAELFERFFRDCLEFNHWASNKTQLGHELRFLMENFNGFYQHKFDMTGLRFPEDMQLIEIELQQDFEAALSTHLNQFLGPEDRFRLIPDSNKKLVAVILKADRSLELRSFSRRFTIRNGFLEPLRQDLVLTYGPGLELSALHEQRLELAPSLSCQFTSDGGRVRGVCLRGFVFQRFLEFRGEPLKEIPRLHLPLRRMEQFFIDRRTDSEYLDLTRKLERTRALVLAGDAEAAKWGPALLIQSETLLEQVYVGDKMLTLLVRDLRHTLEQKGLREECQTLDRNISSASTNS